MEVMMAMEGGEVEFSGCSSNTSVEDEFGYALNHWSPIAEWGTIMGDDELHDLMESMMCEAVHYEPSMPSSTTTSHPGTPPVVAEEDDVSLLTSMTTSSTGTQTMAKDGGDDKGLRMVHLLMAAAEALSSTHQSRDLARVILVRLKELLAPVSAANVSNMERLAAHFTAALQSILDNSSSTGSRRHRDDNHHHHASCHPSDVLAAFQLLQDMSPYVKFGHFTANQAILEAVAGDRRVHIIDYDIMEGIQWASLMQALASRPDGPPAPHLRITAITRSSCGRGWKGIGTVQETGRRLAAFAASIGQPFSFAQCRLDGDELFRPASVRLMKGEAVVVNCMLHLPHSPHRSSGSVTSFLSGAATLNPKIIALVEEEEEPPMVGDGEEGGFVGRFMEALHRYSAVCDAMEAGYPMQGRARGLVERVFLGPRIVDAVERAYRCRGDGGWGEWMAAAGFVRVRISCFNHCQARLLLGLFNDGYTVVEEEHNKLVLGWKSRRLLSTSIWSPPSLTAAAAAAAMQT